MIYYNSITEKGDDSIMPFTQVVHTTKPFMSGRSQAIRIPKEYRLDDEEVIITRVGNSIVITPKASIQDTFFTGLSMFTDDFLIDGRPTESPNERIEL